MEVDVNKEQELLKKMLLNDFHSVMNLAKASESDQDRMVFLACALVGLAQKSSGHDIDSIGLINFDVFGMSVYIAKIGILDSAINKVLEEAKAAGVDGWTNLDAGNAAGEQVDESDGGNCD